MLRLLAVLGTGGILLMAGYAALFAGSDALLDLILGGAVSAGLLGYLLWALVRSEDF